MIKIEKDRGINNEKKRMGILMASIKHLDSRLRIKNGKNQMYAFLNIHILKISIGIWINFDRFNKGFCGRRYKNRVYSVSTWSVYRIISKLPKIESKQGKRRKT